MPSEEKPAPYLKPCGELVIPSDSDQKYQWWNGGQPIRKTLKELDASQAVIDRYCIADKVAG